MIFADPQAIIHEDIVGLIICENGDTYNDDCNSAHYLEFEVPISPSVGKRDNYLHFCQYRHHFVWTSKGIVCNIVHH